MTEIQEEILNRFVLEYGEVKRQLETYSDYELNLIINHLPDSIDDLQSSINMEIQWDILGALCSPFINDWDDFYSNYEREIMDYCWGDEPFIGHNSCNNSYEIKKETVIDVCKDLISNSGVEENYTINEEVDFSEVIAYLNRYYPVKFCEV